MNFTYQFPVRDGLYWAFISGDMDLQVVEVDDQKLYVIGSDMDMRKQAAVDVWLYGSRVIFPSKKEAWKPDWLKIAEGVPKRLAWLVLLLPAIIVDPLVWVFTGKKFFVTDKLGKWSEVK